MRKNECNIQPQETVNLDIKSFWPDIVLNCQLGFLVLKFQSLTLEIEKIKTSLLLRNLILGYNLLVGLDGSLARLIFLLLLCRQLKSFKTTLDIFLF